MELEFLRVAIVTLQTVLYVLNFISGSVGCQTQEKKKKLKNNKNANDYNRTGAYAPSVLVP